MRPRRYVTALIAACAALAIALLAASPAGLLSGDEGIKLAETQALAFSSYRDASLYNPGARYATDRKLQPFEAASRFTFTGDDPAKVYGTYPLLFPAAAVPLFRIGGFRGIALLSLAGFIATLILTARLARRCGLSEPTVAGAVAIVGLGCGLPLYATTIFEHSASVAVLLAAIDVALGGTPTARRMCVAGAVFALATCLRTELYAFAPSMALIVAWRLGLRRASWLRWLGFGAGALAVLGAFLVCHRLATPAWHPTLTASTDGEVLELDRRLGHVIAFSLVDDGWILVVATLVIAAVRSLPLELVGLVRRCSSRLVHRLCDRPPHPAVTLAFAAAWCTAAYLAIRGVGDHDVRTVTGLFTASPVLALALVGGVRRDGSPLGILVAAATAFGAIIVLLPKASANGGLELGARYLLPIVPLLAIGAAAAARRHRLDRIAFTALFAASLCATAVNARALWRVRELGANVLTAVDRAAAPVVFTQVWWVAQLAVPAQADGVSLYVGVKPTAIYDRFYAAGIRRVLSMRGSPPPAIGRIRLRLLPEIVVDDPRLSPHIYELTEGYAGRRTSVPTHP